MNTSLKSALLLTAFSATLLLGSGCSSRRFVPVGTSRQSVKSSSKKECKPSQYWDGETCRHKGQGKGARKHDD